MEGKAGDLSASQSSVVLGHLYDSDYSLIFSRWDFLDVQDLSYMVVLGPLTRTMT